MEEGLCRLAEEGGEAAMPSSRRYLNERERFGSQPYQGLRAARLAGHTVMRAVRWTRDRAISFLREPLALSEPEIDVARAILRGWLWPTRSVGGRFCRCAGRPGGGWAADSTGGPFQAASRRRGPFRPAPSETGSFAVAVPVQPRLARALRCKLF